MGLGREIKYRAVFENNVYDVIRIDFELEEVEIFISKIAATKTTQTLSFKDTKTLQYTGLKDKNGVEIYEGDIVKYYHTSDKLSVCLIVYRESETQFQCKHGSSYFRLGSLVSKRVARNVKVVGNIYQNKDLLK